MTTYLFPGQGSQQRGMGGNLFAKFSEVTEIANKVLGYSIEELCLENPQNKLSMTQYTQPALYTVNTLLYLEVFENQKTKPDFVAGHSLGEYNALLAAGVIDFETGLRLVQKRGELMSQAKDGAMSAIIGLENKELEALLLKNNLKSVVIANINSYSQVVISGPKNEVMQANQVLENTDGVMVIPLGVSGAFHSPLMLDAQTHFSEFVSNFDFQTPSITVISNYTAQPYQASSISENLIQQISQPVRWTETLEYLLDAGETSFQEIGPGRVLSGFTKNIQNKREPA